MGLIHTEDFSGGWNPSVDLINADSKFQPRMDNLVLDEIGGLSLRKGQNCLTTTAITDGIVHGLFTVWQDGVRGRYAAADSAAGVTGIYSASGGGPYSQILSNIAGTGDVSFGADMGQVFISRGTTHYKNDVAARESRVWGIAAPLGRPRVAAVASDGKVFSTFDTGESDPWVLLKGSMVESNGYDGAPGGSRQVNSATGSGEGVIQKVFAATKDFTAYDGGDTGVDEDLIEFYLWIENPSRLMVVSLQIDVNDTDTRPLARFRDDYFYVEITPGDAISMKLDPSEETDNETNLVHNKIDRDDVEIRQIGDQPRNYVPRVTPANQTDGGWARFSIPRGKFHRVGSTPEKGWNTVKAIQFSFTYDTSTSDNVQGTPSNTTWIVKFDDLRITGGARHPYTGKYRVCTQYVSQLGHYTAKSGISPMSREIDLKANALDVSFDITSAEYGWITAVYIYISGGTISGFYRVNIKTATAPSNGSTTYTVRLETSDRDILIQDNQLELNVNPPPNNIVSIAGPFDQRLFCLTEEGLYVSLQNDPDAYSTDHVLQLPGKAATPRFIVNIAGEPILATSRDFYRVVGDGSVAPDGIINYRCEAMNVPPPLTNFYAQEGNKLVYLAADGFRVFEGLSSTPLRGAVDLLFQELTRYGVNPPNLGSAPGRFKGGIRNNKLYVMVPESTPSNTIGAVYVLNLSSGAWYRFVYPTKQYILYREPDGQLLTGDDHGTIFQLEANTGVGDQILGGGYQAIPVVWYTKSHDGSAPLNFKEPEDFRMYGFESDVPATINLHSDENEVAFKTLTIQAGALLQEATSNQSFRRCQMRLTGSFKSFKVRSWTITYRRRPAPRVFWDSGYIRIGHQKLVHARKMIIMMRVQGWVDLKIYFDDELVTTEVIDAVVTVGTPVLTMHQVDFEREVWGRQIRITMQTQSNFDSGAFEPYWAEVYFKTSGNEKLDKKFIPIDGDKI